MFATIFTRGDGTVRLRARIDLVDANASKTWIHCAITGTWEGHPSGPFTFDRNVFNRIVANFKAQKEPAPLTYEHPNYDGNGQPIPAAGWIHALEVRSSGLWAQVELTERAAEMVRKGEYRFCSVVVAFDSTDRVTGEEIGPELYEIGLTNQPFISGLQPIHLSRHGAGMRRLSMDPKAALEAVAKALGLEDGASRDDLVKALDAVAALAEAQDGESEPAAEEAPAEEPPADMAAASDEPAPEVEASDAPAADVALMEEELPGEPPAPAPSDAGMQAISMLMEALGLDEAGALAFLQEHLEQIQALASGASPSGSSSDELNEMSAVKVDALKTRVANLSKRLDSRDADVAALKGKIAELEHEKVTARIDAAIEHGHLGASRREQLVKLARIAQRDPEAAELLNAELEEAKQAPEVPVAKLHRARPPAQSGDEDTGADLDPDLIDTFYKMSAHRFRGRPDKERRADAIKAAREFVTKNNRGAASA